MIKDDTEPPAFAGGLLMYEDTLDLSEREDARKASAGPSERFYAALKPR